jgi:hypothetical protein
MLKKYFQESKLFSNAMQKNVILNSNKMEEIETDKRIILK